MQNQWLSDLPAGLKDELRRAAGATKSLGNVPAARPHVFPPGSRIGQSRHILWARTVPGTGGRGSDARGGSGSRMRRARRNSAQFRAGIIGEFIPGGNAMVVVEFVSLIHHGKCGFAARLRKNRCLPPME